MPLDAESEAILAARRLADIPAVATQTVNQVRASRKSWRQSTHVPTQQVHEVVDLQVPTDDGTVGVRTYRPNTTTGLPVIVYLHGGGWVIGDLDHSDALCRLLCLEAAALIVNVEYRLAPEHKYPAAAEDCFAVVCWLGEHASQLRADARRMAVAGSSAGGNLAAATTLMSRDRGGPELSAQLLVCPVMDSSCVSPSFVEFADGYIVSAEDMRWYWQQYLEREVQASEPYACPLRADDLSGLPDALVITAECDPVRDDGERYATRLRSAGVAVRHTRYPGTLHGFFAMPGANAKGTLAVREAAAWLRDALHEDGPA